MCGECGSGLRIQGSELACGRVQGLRSGLGVRGQAFGFRCLGLWFRVQDAGYSIHSHSPKHFSVGGFCLKYSVDKVVFAKDDSRTNPSTVVFL